MNYDESYADLRELRDKWHNAGPDDRPDTMTAVDELLAVFAEYKQSLRERIEALRERLHHIDGDLVLGYERALDDVLAEIDNDRKTTND